ncbi:uncharacterized protein BX663DRAFT_516497 [Cokeromyces recurvatus]|uniref:uncharacterized protein n=1 Tax=Cokeromyces recurvatus TaxID=90255 RepID=UPI00221EDBD4|nr:uncharacterized protein BX663DRAFT_516497 [Cokeromyces recurvatus]KAI7900783.1 hypothetical protein BX663DRAFT_516497 [Cokeromyces recurvatus]
MKGKLPAPTRQITDAIKKIQTCNHCKNQNLTNITTTKSKRELHAVLKCNSCSTVWNRDVMAAKNINYIFTYMSQHKNKRPREFQRSS